MAHRAQQQRFSFALYAADMSPKAAELSGLMMKDMSVSKDSKYLYKVFLAVADLPAGQLLLRKCQSCRQ
ncbi:MAG: hypothetical protein MJZ15_06460, partial [Bacteroidales bacterium]|nr:hypothetical protein [Bacteroidales bacterium]